MWNGVYVVPRVLLWTTVHQQPPLLPLRQRQWSTCWVTTYWEAACQQQRQQHQQQVKGQVTCMELVLDIQAFMRLALVGSALEQLNLALQVSPLTFVVLTLCFGGVTVLAMQHLRTHFGMPRSIGRALTVSAYPYKHTPVHD